MSRDHKYKDRNKKRYRDYDDDDDDDDDDDNHYKKRSRRDYKKSGRVNQWSESVEHLSKFGSNTLRLILKSITTLGMSIAAIPVLIWGPHQYGFPIIVVALMTLILFFMWFSCSDNKQSDLSHQEIDNLQKEINALKKTLNDHEKRLENTEIIESFENRLARKELERKDEKQNSNIASKPILSDDSHTSKESISTHLLPENEQAP